MSQKICRYLDSNRHIPYHVPWVKMIVFNCSWNELYSYKKKDLINAFCKICNVYMSCLVWYFVQFSFSLSLWELAIPLYCVYVCVDLIKNLIKVRFRLFLVVSLRIVVQGFQQSFHGNNEQEYLLFHSYPIAIVTKAHGLPLKVIGFHRQKN